MNSICSPFCWFSNEKPVFKKIARKTAAEKIYNLRRATSHREHAKKVFIKHGSRKSRIIRNHKDIKTNDNQGELALDTSIKYTSSSKKNK